MIVVNMLFERESGLLLVGMATYKSGENPILLILRHWCNNSQVLQVPLCKGFRSVYAGLARRTALLALKLPKFPFYPCQRQ